MSLPAPVREVLEELPEHRRGLFRARVERWQPDLDVALAGLYPDPGEVRDRLLLLAAQAFAARPEELHDLDLRRTLAPDWFQRPETVGYACYAERFGGTLRGVAERAPYLERLGVRYLHLMPLLTPRPAPNDGGYAVMDYRSVRADLGTVDDLVALTASLRERDISLCLDLVLNHVAREHAWAERARAGEARYYDDRGGPEGPDAYEQTLPEVFPDFAPGSFSHDAELDAWVWTTFHDYQWDLNWANPEVLCEFADLVLLHANHGVEIFRLDAIAFTWKRLGTSCQNQPEVHDLTQALRTVARIAAPAVLFKAEAIVGPQDLMPYLGTGRHHGKVSDLAYHNSLMVQVWSMLASRDVGLASHALRQLPPPPSTTAWVTYARCHDDIGWAIDDADAAACGVTGFGHRGFLSDFYSGEFPGSWARGLVFQENEATGDRRISGSLASLAGLEAGDPLARDRIRLVHALVLGFGGLPVIWSGDELGTLNDATWDADPAHADDNRWVHRPALPDPVPDGGPENGVLADTRSLVAARAATPHLHAATPAEVLEPRDPGVLLVLRRHPLGPMLGAYNVTDGPRPLPLEVLRTVGLDPETVVDRLRGEPLTVRGDTLTLAAYDAVWLTAPG
jgi:amylosucrase